MNIGFVSQALPYLPSRDGFRLNAGNLLRQLSRRHQIHLVSLLIENDAEHLDWARHYCASVRTIPVRSTRKLMAPLSALSAHVWGRPLQQRRSMARALWESVRGWDVLHVEGGYAGGIVPGDLPIAKVLALHDSWTLRCSEMLECAQSFRERLYYTLLTFHEPRYARLVYPRFERCTVVAEPDLRELRKTAPDCTVAMIPSGTDTEYFHPIEGAKEPDTLVFHSHLGYAPNIESALELANEILPRVRERVPNARLHLVGANPDPRIAELASRPGIRISANLPDLRLAVCTGQVYVCAIRHGTGLKSKMLEAMAMQMPIVGYPGSIVGLRGAPGKHYLVAQNAQDFAAHVVDLLQNPQRADDLARAGRALVESEYSWDSHAEAYEQLYQRVVDERRARASSIGGPQASLARGGRESVVPRSSSGTGR